MTPVLSDHYVGTVWFAVVALIDRALAWCPRRWTP